MRAESLAELQREYRLARSLREQRAIAADFAEVVRGGGRGLLEGEPDGLELAGEGGAGVAAFFERYLQHTKGPLAGQPFRLEPWQRAFVDEFYRLDADGNRVYRLGILGVPRGNGKSPLAAGLALYELVSRPDAPDVFCAAASRDQGRIVLDFARSFVEGGELRDWIKVARNELVYEAQLGSMRVLSADGALQHGLSVSAAIVDELHAFTTPKQEELFTALSTALHKRHNSFGLAITTAGFDKVTLLGRMYEDALARLTLERPSECLTVGRDEENGTLLWWYGAPQGAPVDDETLWRAANPASWVAMRDLRRQLHAPGFHEADFRRLHLNQWTAGEHAWITAERWAACRADADIPERASVYVGVDASWTNDATAVAWAHRLPDNRVVVRCHVWSAVAETDAHTFVGGGRIDFEAVEDFILQLAGRYTVKEVVYDPDFFARSAEILSERRLTVAPIDQRSKAMREAYGQFYEAAGSQTVIHDGDPVLTSHVLSASATVDEHGSWRVKKTKQSRKIDGLVACVIAHSRAAREERRTAVAFSW